MGDAGFPSSQQGKEPKRYHHSSAKGAPAGHRQHHHCAWTSASGLWRLNWVFLGRIFGGGCCVEGFFSAGVGVVVIYLHTGRLCLLLGGKFHKGAKSGRGEGEGREREKKGKKEGSYRGARGV
jgi:hypothetical protein